MKEGGWTKLEKIKMDCFAEDKKKKEKNRRKPKTD